MDNILFSFLAATQDEENLTKEKILSAALIEIEAKGFEKMSLEGIAKRAKINRVTIYRYFGNKEKLNAELALKEGKRMARTLVDATAGIEDPDTLFVEGFVAALKFAREHPIIKRTAQFEPDILITAALANDSALLRVGANLMTEAIRWAQERGRATHLNPESAGDTAARLFSSFVLLPGGSYHLANDNAARQYAKETLIPMLLGNSSK